MIAVPGWLRRRPTPAHETTLRRALHAEGARIERTAAPGESGAAAGVNGWKEPKTMTIITRHARDLHAGDVITHDPDHDRPVRWRVTRPAVITSDGEYALADYTDLDTGGHGIAYYPALTGLRVEPAGGAA